jgi:hypothetical protein
VQQTWRIWWVSIGNHQVAQHLCDLILDGKISLKWILKNALLGYGLNFVPSSWDAANTVVDIPCPDSETLLDLLFDYQFFKKGLASWADIRILWFNTCQINGILLITVLIRINWFRILFSCFLNDMSTVRFSAGGSRTLFSFMDVPSCPFQLLSFN